MSPDWPVSEAPIDVMQFTLSRIDERLQHAAKLLVDLHAPLLARRDILSVEYGINRLRELIDAQNEAGHVRLSDRLAAMLGPAAKRADALSDRIDAACAEALESEADARIALVERLAAEVMLDSACEEKKADLLEPSVTAAHEEASLDFYTNCLGEDA